MIIFAYDFPHRKSEDFILFCHFNDIKVDAVIGCNWKKLKISKPKFKTKIQITPIYHPSFLCDKLGIKYYNFDHDSIDCFNLLQQLKPEIGLIAGARILPDKIIKLFKKGIINFHPGDIPEVRGLNSSLRAIKYNHPQVVTAHLIDENIDSGTILFKKTIEVLNNDTIFEINEKLYKTQLLMIIQSIQMTRNGLGEKIKIQTPYHYKNPFENYDEFIETFKKYMK